jgi:phage protein D
MSDVPMVVLLSAGASSPSAVAADVIDAVDRIVVRQEHDGPSTFQLLLNADESARVEDDLPIVGGKVFAPGNRVRIGVRLGSTECWLVDGAAVHAELVYGAGTGTFTYSVIGEDLSVFMRLQEKAAEWPGRSAAQIVREILANYASYGLQSSVTAPENDVTPEASAWIRQQNGDDLSYVRALGRPYGFIFGLHCGTTTSAPTTAYWGPPPRATSSLPALRLGDGTSSDVTSISFSYDGTAAQLYAGGSRDDTASDAALAVASSTEWSLTKLASSPSVTSTLARTRRFIDPSAAGALARSSVDGLTQTSARSAARAVAALDGMEYGAVVTPASLLAVRGAGATYDGNYYVERVEHTLARGSYKQEITMSREGLGSTLTGAV